MGYVQWQRHLTTSFGTGQVKAHYCRQIPHKGVIRGGSEDSPETRGGWSLAYYQWLYNEISIQLSYTIGFILN